MRSAASSSTVPGSETTTTRPARMPTSAGRAGDPEPSTSVPPRINVSSTTNLLGLGDATRPFVAQPTPRRELGRAWRGGRAGGGRAAGLGAGFQHDPGPQEGGHALRSHLEAL